VPLKLKSKNKIKLPKGADFTVDEKPVKVSTLFAFMKGEPCWYDTRETEKMPVTIRILS